VIVDPLQRDRAVADHGIDVGGGREAAEAPGLLVPAAALDPDRGGPGRGIGGDAALRVGERGRGRQVELELAEAELHDMAVGVDHARQQRAAARVEAEVEPVGPGIAAAEQAHDLAVLVDQEPVKRAT
jgi:hypothetical protein